MFKFGSEAPRSLTSFGVAGLIKEEGKVYFETLFNTRHIGRVSDLISARLRKAAPDDLRLRSLLLLTAFEGIRNQPGYDSRKDTLKEPLVIECGMDGDQIAIGMAFTLKDPDLVRAEGLPQRVSIRKATNELEVLLVQIDQLADRLVVRYHEASRRMEVVALMALAGGGIAQEEAEKRELLEWVLIKDPELTPRPSQYIALADTEYTELLRDETRIQGSRQQAQRQALINSRGAVQESDRVVSGSTDEDDDGAVKVGGGREKSEGFLARFRSKGKKGSSDAAVVVAGGESAEDDGTLGVGGGFRQDHEPDEESDDVLRLKSKGKGARKRKVGVDSAGSQEDGDLEEENEDEGIGSGSLLNPLSRRLKKFAKRSSFFKKILSLGDEDEAEESQEQLQPAPAESLKAVAETFVIQGQKEEEAGDLVLKTSGDEESESSGELAPESLESDAAMSVPTAQEGPTEADIELERSIKAIDEGANSRTLMRLQGEAGDIKKELTTERAKKWVEGLTTELIGERARIQEVAKRMNAAIRQKDHEFKVKESALHEELNRKNEQLLQKSSALNRAKEQMAQLSKSLEQMKKLEDERADDMHLSQKYNMTQRMLAHSKEENKNLVKKLDQLRAQVDRLQLQKGTNKGPSMTEFTALQNKYDRAFRQAEEFKRVNQQLLAQVNTEKKNNAVGTKVSENDETKRRLEAAVRLAAQANRETDRVNNRLAESEKERERLKAELERAQDLLRISHTLKRKRSGSGEGSPPAESA